MRLIWTRILCGAVGDSLWTGGAGLTTRISGDSNLGDPCCGGGVVGGVANEAFNDGSIAIAN